LNVSLVRLGVKDIGEAVFERAVEGEETLEKLSGLNGFFEAFGIEERALDKFC
jgi:hypothetical protein